MLSSLAGLRGVEGLQFALSRPVLDRKAAHVYCTNQITDAGCRSPSFADFQLNMNAGALAAKIRAMHQHEKSMEEVFGSAQFSTFVAHAGLQGSRMGGLARGCLWPSAAQPLFTTTKAVKL